MQTRIKAYVILQFLLRLWSTESVVNSNAVEWGYLSSHPVSYQEEVTNSDLERIISEEWSSLRHTCTSLPPDPSISISFDSSLIGGYTLAWASQTLVLNTDLTWWPSLVKNIFNGYDMVIGVNPSPPNGWHTDVDCLNIGYRYDLRTILRHELLHGISISSSVYSDGSSWSVGHYFSGVCFPRFFDTKIKDSSGDSVVSGCTVLKDLTNEKLYLGDVELYNPASFQPGSSISHHNYPGNLMYYSISAMTCQHLGNYEIMMLGELSIPCSNLTGAGTCLSPSLFLTFVLLLVLLLLHF